MEKYLPNTQNATSQMCTTLRILKINPVNSGIAKESQEPYDWHTAECALLDDDGNVSSVGRLVFPKTLRETLGGVPPIGTYRAVISLVILTVDGPVKIFVPRIVDLVPISDATVEANQELGALACAAKDAADRAGSAIDDAMAVIAASNKRIASMESAAGKTAMASTRTAF